MRLSAVALPLISLALASVVPKGAQDNLRYTEGTPSNILSSLNQDAAGALSIGPDGVLRSFNANRTVIDYRQLDGAQYLAFTAAFPESNNFDSVAHFVDGLAILDAESLWKPSDEILPRMLGQRDVIVPDIMARTEGLDAICNPPKSCVNSNGCSAGCRSCTFVGWFPYGVCMGGSRDTRSMDDQSQ